MTRNPLADPGLLGINGGAALGVVICILGFGITDRRPFLGGAWRRAGSLGAGVPAGGAAAPARCGWCWRARRSAR
ncbi:iron chelate uptake ABC transporter family permease subunit (plasmid) [Leisingera aquaemixtae]|uniref:iron chelate uptake ABC transporter family permease subunit n=1 Tax=Leisingera aquaemixtae TaxID=1396826 RepID=UPI0039843546